MIASNKIRGFLLAIFVCFSVGSLYAGQPSFVLIDEDTGVSSGPYELRDGVSVKVGRERATIRLAADDDRLAYSRKKAQMITIPAVIFRQALLTDVIDYLQMMLNQVEKKGPPLQIELRTERKACDVTLNLKDTSVYDALQQISSLCDVELVWSRNKVVIADRSSAFD